MYDSCLVSQSTAIPKLLTLSINSKEVGQLNCALPLHDAVANLGSSRGGGASDHPSIEVIKQVKSAHRFYWTLPGIGPV